MADRDDLIIELGTEELPPIALKRLSEAFVNGFEKLLNENNLKFTAIQNFATPRRLAILVSGLEVSQPDSTQTKLGPAVAAAFDADGNPSKAAQGFARSCGVAVTELATIETDKGPRLGLEVTNKGNVTADLLPEMIKKSLAQLPIPKAMRWGNRQEAFIRPVKWLMVVHGSSIVPMELFGCASGNISRGHRFMDQGNISLQQAADYEQALEQVKVIASQQRRMEIIRDQVEALAQDNNSVAVIDDSLLEEVSALVEWPVALVGNFDPEFLSVPQEALISTMSKNQKYFHMENAAGELQPKFITISNLVSKDPATIITGNEKVIRPRLADAKFFYEQDCKHSLSSYDTRLEGIVFQNKLGSVKDKCQRIAQIALNIAESLSADPQLITAAAGICKSDLVTNMVNEFPSLQGIMGNYYAQAEGLDAEVCSALEEIYLPKHAGDKLPQTKTGICLALADRLDTLVGIFGIDQIPTGNKDPFALRRAALGVLNIIITHKLDLNIETLIEMGLSAHQNNDLNPETQSKLMDFFKARLKAMYQEQGINAQIFNAVDQTGSNKPFDFDLRVQAVKLFATTTDADNLSESNKRVANILSKNLLKESVVKVNEALLVEEEEQRLYQAIQNTAPLVNELVAQTNYSEALSKATLLKDDIDRFFDKVMVMSEDEATKNNRLALLRDLRSLFTSIADISCLQR